MAVHREGLDWFGTRADRRGPPCVMQATRTPVPMAVSSPSGGLNRHEHDGCPTTIVETNHSFEDSRAVGQGREVRPELDSAVVPDDCLPSATLNSNGLSHLDLAQTGLESSHGLLNCFLPQSEQTKRSRKN